MKYADFELLDGDYPLEKGEKMPPGTLHVWTQEDGQWACRAYDHGPMCRRCTKLDLTTAACISNVLTGVMEVMDDPAEGLTFWVSETGRTRVETAIRRGGFAHGLDA